MQFSRRIFAAGSAASFGALALPARAATIEMKCATNLPVDHPNCVRLTQMWDAVEHQTGGRLRVKFFPNSMLGGDAAMLTQVRVGALQFFLITPANLASVVPPVDIAYLGFAYKNVDEALRVMDGPLGGYLQAEVAAKGLRMLRSAWDSGMLQIASGSHPIRVPDDLRGFRIRVPESRILSDLVKELGASPTPLSGNEVYTGLQTKIVDGTSAPLVTIEAARWYEVQKYISITNHAWSGFLLVANGDAWTSLPPGVQGIVEKANTTFAGHARRDTKLADISLADKLARQGLAINRVDQTPFRARLHAYYQYWQNAFGATEWNLLQAALGHNLL